MNILTYLKRRSLQADLFRLVRLHEFRKFAEPYYWKDTFQFLVILAISVFVSLFLNSYGIAREAVYMGGIFIFAALLWATEALPLFATAILIFGLQIIFLSNPGNWSFLGFEKGDSPNYQEILSPLADPIIVLFFGGFLLALAAVKQGVDKKLAGIVLHLFGQKPKWVLLGLMSITAIFSMWMSNTATAAMMITFIAPMLIQLPKDSSLKKAFLLSVPFAANIGGIGTPIGTPPNAVAIGFLKLSGIEVGFLDWMIIGIPFVIILTLFTWLLLWFSYKSDVGDTHIKIEIVKIKPRGYFVIFIFAATVILWVTEGIHGLPSAVTSLLPAIAFTMAGLIDRDDINSLEWHILILIAGGISLGQGIHLTGLDKLIVSHLPNTAFFSLIIFSVAGLVVSTFISHTAAANLLIPIAVSFATVSGNSTEAIILGLAVSFSTTFAMALPISTPPNAIAYAKGGISTQDFLKMGGIIGITGLIMLWISLKFLVGLFA